MLVAVTRPVSTSLGRCELTFLDREPIDLALARRQHAAYEQALASLGALLVRLPQNDELPDAVFVEDTALVLDELAIIPIMGAESRRPETVEVSRCLGRFRPLRRLEAPATLDGGDVMVAEKTIYVGRSARTNDAAMEQLQRIVEPHGYTVVPLDPRGCLHLKSACTYLGRKTVLANPDWIDPAVFDGLRVVTVDPAEPFAANAVGLAGHLLFPNDFPKTRARLEAEDFRILGLDTAELRKAESALTCMSLLFDSGNPV
jgi:dimethylargininase